jgi:hypothetical protein
MRSFAMPRLFGALGIVCLFSLSAALAQGQPPVRVRGTIEKVDGQTLVVKSREGESLTIRIADNARLTTAVRVPLSEVKLNSYVAVTAMPQPDGSQRALEVMIFPEALRGTGEGHGPWDSRPQSTMTNATVTETVAGIDGQVLTVRFKDQEKKVVVPPDAAVITVKPVDRSELKPGVKIFIFAAQRQPDGTLQASSITIGRDA